MKVKSKIEEPSKDSYVIGLIKKLEVMEAEKLRIQSEIKAVMKQLDEQNDENTSLKLDITNIQSYHIKKYGKV